MLSVGAGLLASICCGGSLLFVPLGLGAVYASLGLWRYIPEALAAGALAIVAINYVVYATHGQRSDALRAMRGGAAAGLGAMVGSFVLLEWLNHAVVNAHRFMARPEFRAALIPGVPNGHLAEAGAVWAAAMSLVWLIPLPGRGEEGRVRGRVRM
jgi:hypothetical protein